MDFGSSMIVRLQEEVTILRLRNATLGQQLDELKASIPKIKADAVISVLDNCAWHHGKEFIKIGELIEYANQLEGKE